MSGNEKPLVDVEKILSNLLKSIYPYGIKNTLNTFCIVNLSDLPETIRKNFKTLQEHYRKADKIEIKKDLVYIGKAKTYLPILVDVFKIFEIIDSISDIDYYYYDKKLPIIILAGNYVAFISPAEQ